MIDINRIRNYKEDVEKALLKRMDNVNLTQVLEWDKEKRQIGTLMDQYRAERRKVSDTIPQMKKEGKDTTEIVNQMKELGNKIDEGMVKYNELDIKIFDYLAGLPNIPDEDVPAGGKESNEVLRAHLEKPKYNFKIKPHYEILKELNMVDFERGIKIAGEKSWIYTGIGARLEWALINYFIDTHIKNGFQFVMLPYMLKYDCGFGAGQFPKFNDTGAWEKVAHDLAKLCGLNVPEAKLEKFSKYGSTFLVKRFDRDGEQRIHFASAMTLLGKSDGASAADGTSYLDIVGFIKSYGAEPKNDLVELWKRIVFNMAVTNTDDHLRNHAFILSENGWKLSPLYDVNPVPYGDELSLLVNDEDNRISIPLAISVAPIFGIKEAKAKELAEEIKQVVMNNWERLAKEYDLSRGEIENMRPAFII